MRTGNVLFSAVHFLVTVALFFLGGFLIALKWAPSVRFKLSSFFTDRPDLFIPLGAVLLVMGLTLLIGFTLMYRGSYYRLAMRGAEVDVALLRTAMESYWKTVFPQEELTTEVFLHKDQKIELVAEIPKLPEEERLVLLANVEKEIGDLLARQLGYKREFLITVVVK